MKTILTLLLATGIAHAGPYYDLTPHSSSTTMKLSGDIKIAASTTTPNTQTITLKGSNGVITAGGFTTTGPSTAAYYYGNGAALTGIPSTASIVGVYLPLAGGTMTGTLNVSSTVYVTGKSTFAATGHFSAGVTASTGLFSPSGVGITTTSFVPALVVVSTAFINGEILLPGSGGYGRFSAAMYGVPGQYIRMDFGGHSQANRDNSSVVGGYYSISAGSAHSWGSDRYAQMTFDPGADEQGHLAIGGNSAQSFLGSMNVGFSIGSLKGYYMGANTSGNTKLSYDEMIAVEQSGRVVFHMGSAGGNGRAWTMVSGTDGIWRLVDLGTYGGATPNLTMLAASQYGVNIGTATFGLGATMSSFTTTGFFVPRAMTKAQIAAYTPSAAELWGIVTCSDCASPGSVCQSTGTVLMGLRLGLTGTTQCQ